MSDPHPDSPPGDDPHPDSPPDIELAVDSVPKLKPQAPAWNLDPVRAVAAPLAR